MTIDTKRLASDPGYWDECGAPEDATHFSPAKADFDPCWMKFDGRWQAKYTGSTRDNWGFDDPDDNPERYIPSPQKPEVDPLSDSHHVRRIGELGNQVHNLGCELQSDEDLADELAAVAAALWDIQRVAWSKIKDERKKEELNAIIDECMRNSDGDIADAIIAAGWKKDV